MKRRMTLAAVLFLAGSGVLCAKAANIDVRLLDAQTGRELPGRLTIVDPRGVLVPVSVPPSPRVAARTGVVFTADGRVRLGLPSGRYTIYGTRGFEYGVDSRTVPLDEGETRPIELRIGREVATPGLIACDPHVHTANQSGPGDATLDERLVSIAGEGIELPVATDHNHLTDYEPRARELGLREAFTPVLGDEVTTRRGHFSAFPFAPKDAVPDPGLEHWPDLMRAIRGNSADRVIVLNHPRDRHSGFRPFGDDRFNAAVGESREGIPYTFDALEVVNSSTLSSDPWRVIRDWFALWNHGQQVTALGASDSQDIGSHPVGQARTYLACRDADPGRIDVAEACRSLREGRAYVCLGLLTKLSVEDRFGPGDLATGLGEKVQVAVTVLGTSWTRADRVELFANGVRIRDQRIEGDGKRPEKARVTWTLPRPAHDIALVAVASGPAPDVPFWPLPRPAPPAADTGTPGVLGLTNPVRIDADGDGAWSSPRYYAQFAIEIFGTEPSSLFRGLARFDEAVATQAAAFCFPPGRKEQDATLRDAIRTAPDAIRRGFEAYEASIATAQPEGR